MEKIFIVFVLFSFFKSPLSFANDTGEVLKELLQNFSISPWEPNPCDPFAHITNSPYRDLLGNKWDNPWRDTVVKKIYTVFVLLNLPDKIGPFTITDKKIKIPMTIEYHGFATTCWSQHKALFGRHCKAWTLSEIPRYICYKDICFDKLGKFKILNNTKPSTHNPCGNWPNQLHNDRTREVKTNFEQYVFSDIEDAIKTIKKLPFVENVVMN